MFNLLFGVGALLLGPVALAAPGDDPAEVETTPSTAAGDDGVAARARATSVARLRDMLGAHAKGPPLVRPIVVGAIDGRHPKVRALVAAVAAARGDRLRTRFYDVTVATDTKAAVDGYYRYVISDNTVTADVGAATLQAGWRFGLDGSEGALPDYYGEYKTLAGGEVRLHVGLDLLEGLVTDSERTALRQADVGIDLAEADLALTELVVLRDGVEAWAKWVGSGRILALDQALLDVANQRQQAVDQRIGLGDLAPVERVRNRQIVAQREADLVSHPRAWRRE